MPLWRFPAPIIEDHDTNTLHRPDCAEIDRDHEFEEHPAGSSIRRRVAPRECWSRRPDVEMLLGV